MCKKNKGYVKVKRLKGTIFDKAKASEIDLVTQQRRLGFFARHGIDPKAVASTDDAHTFVRSIGDGMVRVHYFAIYIPEGWKPAAPDAVPPGVECHHGGYKKHHTVSQMKYVDARLEEVL